jgi:hypothetical protein
VIDVNALMQPSDSLAPFGRGFGSPCARRTSMRALVLGRPRVRLQTRRPSGDGPPALALHSLAGRASAPAGRRTKLHGVIASSNSRRPAGPGRTVLFMPYVALRAVPAVPLRNRHAPCRGDRSSAVGRSSWRALSSIVLRYEPDSFRFGQVRLIAATVFCVSALRMARPRGPSPEAPPTGSAESHCSSQADGRQKRSAGSSVRQRGRPGRDLDFMLGLYSTFANGQCAERHQPRRGEQPANDPRGVVRSGPVPRAVLPAP